MVFLLKVALLYKLKPNIMTLTIEIEVLEPLDVLEVEFEANPTWENDGYGSWQVGSQFGFDKGNDFAICEDDPTWDRRLYRDHENKAIESNLDKVIEQFCNQLIKDKNDEEDF